MTDRSRFSPARWRSTIDVANLIPNLADVKPRILVAVPRIFNRIYESVTGDHLHVELVAIDEGAIRAWAEQAGVTLDGELEHDPRVRALIREELAAQAWFESPLLSISRSAGAVANRW